MYASVEMSVVRNLSYGRAPSQPTTSGPQTTDHEATGQSVSGAAAEYSIIGPSYDTTTANSREQQNRGLAMLSERYEFSGAYLAMGAGTSGAGSGAQGEAANYEVPLSVSQSRECKEYSHLQH